MSGTRVSQALTRLRKNAAYFKINYFIILLLSTAVCMVMNPSSLVVLGLLALSWIYLFAIRTAPLVIGGRTFR
jgi:PRA1 family protein 1